MAEGVSNTVVAVIGVTALRQATRSYETTLEQERRSLRTLRWSSAGHLPPLVMILTIFYLIFTPLNWYDTPVAPIQNTAGWVSFVLGMTWIAVTVPISNQTVWRREDPWALLRD